MGLGIKSWFSYAITSHWYGFLSLSSSSLFFLILEMGFLNLLNWKLGSFSFFEKKGFALIEKDLQCYERWYFGGGFHHLLPILFFFYPWNGFLQITGNWLSLTFLKGELHWLNAMRVFRRWFDILFLSFSFLFLEMSFLGGSWERHGDVM